MKNILIQCQNNLYFLVIVGSKVIINFMIYTYTCMSLPKFFHSYNELQLFQYIVEVWIFRFYQFLSFYLSNIKESRIKSGIYQNGRLFRITFFIEKYIYINAEKFIIIMSCKILNESQCMQISFISHFLMHHCACIATKFEYYSEVNWNKKGRYGRE